MGAQAGACSASCGSPNCNPIPSLIIINYTGHRPQRPCSDTVEMVLSMWSAADGPDNTRRLAPVSENELPLPCLASSATSQSPFESPNRYSYNSRITGVGLAFTRLEEGAEDVLDAYLQRFAELAAQGD